MKKMKLELEALQVESFVTATGGRSHGTVRGNAGSYNDLNCGIVPQTYQAGCTNTGCPSVAAAGGCSAYPCGPEASLNSCLNTCGDGDNCTQGETFWDGCTNNYKLCG
jgi:hypothetical protein